MTLKHPPSSALGAAFSVQAVKASQKAALDTEWEVSAISFIHSDQVNKHKRKVLMEVQWSITLALAAVWPRLMLRLIKFIYLCWVVPNIPGYRTWTSLFGTGPTSLLPLRVLSQVLNPTDNSHISPNNVHHTHNLILPLHTSCISSTSSLSLASLPQPHLYLLPLCTRRDGGLRVGASSQGAQSANQWSRTISHTQFETLTSISISVLCEASSVCAAI